MAFNEHLGERIERILKDKNVMYQPKRMFGGISYLVDGKMCVGIVKNNMMVRVDPADENKLLEKEGCLPMDFTGKPLKGYLFITPLATDMDEDLAKWIQLALDFNPKVKKSGRKK